MDTITETDAATSSASTGGMPADLAEAMDDLGLTDYIAETAAPKTPAAPRKTREERAEEAAAAAGDEPADEVTRTAAEVGEGEDGAAAPTAEDEAKAKDLAELRGVRARAAARKRARETQGAPGAAAAAPVAAAPAAKPAAAAAVPAPLNAAEREVAQAARDVIAQIAKLAGDDADSKANGAAPDPARAAEIADLRRKADALSAQLEGDKALTDKYGALEEKLQAQADRQFVNDRIDTVIALHASRLPELSAVRNGTALVYSVAEKFLKDHGRAPDLRFVAEKVEAVLARRAGNGEGASPATAKAKETQTAGNPRKTVSHRTATPPAARTKLDERTSKQVEQDLYNSIGLASEYSDD